MSESYPGKWVMSSLRGDGGVHFYIGSIRVAKIAFRKGAKGVYLICDGPSVTEHDSVSDAMKQMHKHLQSPPPESI